MLYSEQPEAKSRSIGLSRDIVIALLKFAALIAVATLAPLIGNQWITGPLVNATLFIAVVIVGLRGAIIVALVPSVIALSIGLLPAILAPLIPFIMLSNVTLAAVFDRLRLRNYWLGMIAASIAKFILLYAAAIFVTTYFLQNPVATKLAQMFSWPQLATALAGGILAWAFLKAIKRI